MIKQSKNKLREIRLIADCDSNGMCEVKAFDKNFHLGSIHCQMGLLWDSEHFKYALNTLLMGYSLSEEYDETKKINRQYQKQK